MIKKTVSKVAVLGNGVMGSQIAAHCANARVETLLFGISTDLVDPASSMYALRRLGTIKPPPLATPDLSRYIRPASYSDDCECLKECDLIIEAVSENIDIKRNVYQQVGEHIRDDCLIGSNTSGLSIEVLSSCLPQKSQHNFCGVHFFNPPRYLPLVELIPSTKTSEESLNTLEEWLTTMLGKHIVIAKNTPGFIANRLGIFASLSALHHGERLGLGFDLIDELTGKLIKRSKSATCRTIDMVGLDIFSNVAQYLHTHLPDDPWREYFVLPQWLEAMVVRGDLGQKTGAGIYRKREGQIEVFNPHSGKYHPRKKALDDEIQLMMRQESPKMFESLSASEHPQAQFLYATMCDVMHYAAYNAEHISHSLRDIDFAMRWGYGWQEGIFEKWQSIGWQQVRRNIGKRIQQDSSSSKADLPEWVSDDSRNGVFNSEGAWSPSSKKYIPLRKDSIYQRQLYVPTLLGEAYVRKNVISEDEDSIIWLDDEIIIISFKTKLHSLNYRLIKRLEYAIDLAENDYKGLIIGHQQPPFCAGANLFELLLTAKVGKINKARFTSWIKETSLRLMKPEWPDVSKLPPVNEVIEYLQKTFMRLRNCHVPTVAMVDGLALGGGCEMLMHCDRTVASMESYIGLVEIGVGLLPAGGGCKEMAVRASADAKGGDIFPHISRYYEQIAKGAVSSSALNAKAMGYLRESDVVVMNSYELLYIAKQQLSALFDAGYRPPHPQQRIRVAGTTANANLHTYLVNLREGDYISEYDYCIASKISKVLCGVPLAYGEEASATWYLEQERKIFTELLQKEKTQDRIEYMLKHGKPLRN